MLEFLKRLASSKAKKPERKKPTRKHRDEWYIMCSKCHHHKAIPRWVVDNHVVTGKCKFCGYQPP